MKVSAATQHTKHHSTISSSASPTKVIVIIFFDDSFYTQTVSEWVHLKRLISTASHPVFSEPTEIELFLVFPIS